jgi:Outer membrane lipoprotein-sorting protein
MKKIFLLLVTLGTFIGVKAQTVDEVIEKHLTALGGKEALLKINTVVKEGKATMQGNEMTMKTTALNKKGFRLDISVMGMDGYQITTPTKGWSYMPFGGNTAVEDMPADKVKAGQNDLETQSIFLNYKEKGTTVELLGTEKLDNVDHYKVKAVFTSGSVNTYFISKETLMISKASSVRNGGAAKEITYTDYKKVSGIMMAYTLKRETGDINFETITINAPVDESIFKPSN